MIEKLNIEEYKRIVRKKYPNAHIITRDTGLRRFKVVRIREDGIEVRVGRWAVTDNYAWINAYKELLNKG